KYSYISNSYQESLKFIDTRFFTASVDEETNPRTVLQCSPGILLFFYSDKVPTRLFVVLMVFTVQ
ncbi:hypothetical protein, partial [Roseburia sp. 1XD42-69]|uniref:hypothetical protein n=1 Tax=Roseburia sp. 1XD42-69 TaxID=2320088 RepID=UPI001A9C257B